MVYYVLVKGRAVSRPPQERRSLSYIERGAIMGQIVFARTRHRYDSYTDFWQLVDLSEYLTCYVDEIDFHSDNLYITSPMNGDYRAHVANHAEDRTCVLMHWLLERPGDSIREFRDTNQELIDRKLVDLNLVSCPQMARDTGFHYVVMGSHPGLGIPNYDMDKVYDAIGLMAYTPRRAFLFQTPERVKGQWYSLRLAPNGWGNERDYALRHSHFAINIHKDKYVYCEPLRMALFAAYDLFAVSEALPDDHPYGRAVITTDLARFYPTCMEQKRLMENPLFQNRNFRNTFCTVGNTFRGRLEASI